MSAPQRLEKSGSDIKQEYKLFFVELFLLKQQDLSKIGFYIKGLSKHFWISSVKVKK